MEFEKFKENFCKAVDSARAFTQSFIEESLPNKFVFRLRLNSSYDGNPLQGDEKVYPEDSSPEVAKQYSKCTFDEVLQCLWRDSFVPEWINVSVISQYDDYTLLEVVSCGRFTATDDYLYHAHEEKPPFHVLGPTLPVGYEDGVKFSIYHHSECCDLQELACLNPHSHKVWSLELSGANIDNEVLNSLSGFENVEIIDLNNLEVNTPFFPFYRELINLRVLRVKFSDVEKTVLNTSLILSQLEELSLYNLPDQRVNLADLSQACPNIEYLNLASRHACRLEGEYAFRQLKNLTLEYSSIATVPLVCGLDMLESLRLSGEFVTDDLVISFLKNTVALKFLTLSATQVGDGLADWILENRDLECLNLVDTNVTEGKLEEIRKAKPNLRLFPRNIKPNMIRTINNENN